MLHRENTKSMPGRERLCARPVRSAGGEGAKDRWKGLYFSAAGPRRWSAQASLRSGDLFGQLLRTRHLTSQGRGGTATSTFSENQIPQTHSCHGLSQS